LSHNVNLQEVLDGMEEQVASSEGTFSVSGGVAATGLLATAGYVLLNTRAGFWLLSLMTSRPLWRDFDPLEIVYAWENEPDAPKQEEGDKGGSLLSLVE
jgi:hypothetical protein